MNKLKEQEITEGKWDILIILDACRYDFFRKVYGNYLPGHLKKRKSRGSGTTEWLAKTFKEVYDITYISANPYVKQRRSSAKTF